MNTNSTLTSTSTQLNGAATAAVTNPMVSANVASTKPSPPWQSDPAVQRIHNAFILGWSLVELRGRVQVAALDERKLPLVAKTSASIATSNTTDPVQILVIGANERLLRTSRMRTIFNSIVTLTRAKFPTSVTIDTLYDPPEREAVPYLYPDNPDYANIGIDPLKDKDTGNPIWGDFRLFEITRRAINCLTLLLVDPEESLTPELVSGYQLQLTQAILKAAEDERKATNAASGSISADSTARSLATTAVLACEKKGAEWEPITKQGEAITILSFLTIRLLQAWDGYLRERFTAEGFDANNLLSLVAYEAGRNMATLSWNTSANAVSLENQTRGDEDHSRKSGDQLYQVWKETFTDSALTLVLNQITALSAVLDDAYYRIHPRPTALTTDDPLDDLLIIPDPDLPSQALQAVKESIEYWRRTVCWLGKPAHPGGADGQVTNKDKLTLDDWKLLRNALIEQSGIWFNLMTSQQGLRGFTIQGITQQILDKAIADFRALAQRDLPAATRQVAQQLNDMAEKAAQTAKDEIDRLFNNVSPVLWVVIGVSGLAIIILLVYMALTGNSAVFAGIVPSLLTAVLGLFGIKRGDDTKTTSQQNVDQQKNEFQSTLTSVGSGLAGTVSNALEQAGDFLVSAYNKALQRLQIEVQAMNFSIAVAHSLMEFLILQYGIEGKLDFLDEVIWDKASREAQLRNMLTAAFGPISLLLGSSPEEKGNSSNVQPPAELSTRAAQ